MGELLGKRSGETRARSGTDVRKSRSQNERLILSLLRSQGAMAKADIARATGLSAQSASVIMRRLEGDGLLQRCEPVRGKVGQPSVPMQLAPQGALFYGLKVGRRSSDLVLVDFLGRVIGRTHRTYRYPAPDRTLDFVQTSIAELAGRLSPDQRERIAGLGIAIPGHLWEWAAVIGEPPENMVAWRERDIRAEIAKLYDFPIFLQNDASSACGAEQVFGKAEYPPDFLHFYVGYFIGGGVVLNGALFTGPQGNAGAVGPLRVPIEGNGVQTLLDIASLSVLEKAIHETGGDPAVLWESCESWDVDPEVLGNWLGRAADGLASAIVAALSFIDFPLVVIDGWLPREIRGELVRRANESFLALDLAGLNKPEIREGTIGPDARVLGAASLPLLQQFLVPARAT